MKSHRLSFGLDKERYNNEYTKIDTDGPCKHEDDRMNVVEGTRQNRTVTSEEGAPLNLLSRQQ